MLRIATFGGVQPAALAELTSEVLNGLARRPGISGVRSNRAAERAA